MPCHKNANILTEMTPYYRLLTSITPAHPLLLDPPSISISTPNLDPVATTLQESLAKMEQFNKGELEKLDERLKEAEKTEGESEISDALKARANYLTKIGDKVRLRGYMTHVHNGLVALCLA
jgi:26S proteasome regulatory subunit N7